MTSTARGRPVGSKRLSVLPQGLRFLGEPQLAAVAGAIRDLRDEIMAALRTKGNFLCGRKDVILSGGSGYRLAESITVAGGDHGAEEAGDTDDVDDPGACLVLNTPDEPGVGRQTWILERLAEGALLKAPDVAKQFQCSVKTAQRALTALREEGKIEFVGASRTGTRLRRPRKCA